MDRSNLCGAQVRGIRILFDDLIQIFQILCILRKRKGLNGAAFEIGPQTAACQVIGTDCTPCGVSILQQINFAVVGCRGIFGMNDIQMVTKRREG